MSDWSDGYVVDQEYTTQYFQELAPAHLDFSALMRGVAPPEHDRARFRFCELGCGNGLSTNVIAAANPDAEVHGIDFMPVHISNARRLAREGEIGNVAFHEMAFADAVDADFPQFDYIVTHGVYSWITPENRREMVEFIRKFLAPGGLVYVSYNSLPGWATIAPLQRLFSEYAAIVPGQSTQKVRQAIQFGDKLKEAKAAAFATNQRMSKMMEGLEKKPVNYLAQEYLNQAWYPLYVTQAMAEMGEAKLSFAASATFMENNYRYMLSQEQAALVNELPTAELRELVRDFCVNSQFRRDVYTRGGRRLSRNEQRELMGQAVVALRVAGDAVKYETQLMGRQAKFDTPVVRAAVEALSAGPLTIKEIQEASGAESFEKAYSAIEALLISGQASPVMRKEGATPAAFNREVLSRTLTERTVHVLASGVGSGMAVGAMDQICLKNFDGDDANGLADRVYGELRAAGRNVMIEGKPAADEAAAKAELLKQAERFMSGAAPSLKAFGLDPGRAAT